MTYLRSIAILSILIMPVFGCGHRQAPPATAVRATQGFGELDRVSGPAQSPPSAAAPSEPAAPPAGPFHWARALGDAEASHALAVAVDPEGGILVAGQVSQAAFVRKLDPVGAPLWEQAFAGEGKVAGLAVDRAGVITAVGSFSGSLQVGETFLASAGSRSDLFIVRLSPQGRVLWGKRFGSTFYETATAVAVDAGGNCYLTGTYQQGLDFGLGSLDNRMIYDVFVVKLDPDGKAVWQRGFHAEGGTETTGLALAVAANGDLLVAGRVQGTADFGRGVTTPHPGNSDAFVARLSAAGQPLGARRFGGGDAEAYGVAVDRQGAVLLTGGFKGKLRVDGSTTLASAGARDIFLLALDADLGPRWSKRFGGTGYDLGHGVVVDARQRVLVAGAFDCDLGDGGPVGPGGNDGFLSALDSRGGHLFTVRVASAGDDGARAVVLARDGEPIIAGSFGGAIASAGLVAVGKHSAFVAKIAADRAPAAEMARVRVPDAAAPVLPRPTPTAATGEPSEQDIKLATSAAERGDLPLLQSLVPGRVPASATRADGWSLLYIAAYRGKAEVVRYLLQQRAEPNGKGASDYTSLHQAARWGYVDTVRVLLEGRADANASEGTRNGTPLHVAIAEAKGDAELTKLLLAHGARTETRDRRGRTPLMLAVEKKRDDVVDALLAARADANAQDETKNSVLAWAAITDNQPAAEKLLAHGARVDEPNDNQMTPLFHAAHGGHTAIVAALLERKARPNCVETRYGDSALMRAANAGHLETVKLLVGRKAKLELENKDGLTAFMMAARNGQRSVVDYLLSQRANAKHKDKNGMTALDLARKQNQRAMVSFLEERLGKR